MTLRNAALAALAAAICACGAGERPPNVIFVLTDDFTTGVAGFENPAGAHTPTLDRLAAEGSVFTRAYTPVGWCTPSRLAILTGLHPQRTGTHANADTLSEPVPTFPGELRRLGYRTAVVGKFRPRFADPADYGFAEHVIAAGLSGGRRKGPRGQVYLVNGQRLEAPDDPTEFFTDHAIRLVREARDEPLFLWLTYIAPHRRGGVETGPLWSHAAGFEDRVPPSEVRLPPSIADDLSTKPAVQRADRAHEYFTRLSPTLLRAEIARYYSVVSHLDHQIGRLVAALEELGVADDTILVFSTDNGIFLGHHRMLLKGANAYEEQYRVPFLVHNAPGARPGERIDALVYNFDVGPTLIEWAGGRAPASMQGRSFAGLLGTGTGTGTGTGAGGRGRDALLLQNVTGGVIDAIVTPRYKLAEYAADSDELYDLESDPHEMRNLIDDPRHAALASELRGRLEALRRELE